MKAQTGKKLTIAMMCRSMILAGRSDAQIWAALKRSFGRSREGYNYVAWYRSEVKRNGWFLEVPETEKLHGRRKSASSAPA